LIAMTTTRIPLTAAALALAALGLAACSTGMDMTPIHAVTPGAQFALRVETGADKIALAAHADGLSDAQLQALKAMAARRAEVGGGVITLSLPHGPADAAAETRTADAAQTVLTVAGVPVQRATYDSDDPKAPLLVSFDYEKAVVPHCARWDDLTATYHNDAYANFGCSVNANMAAQIANPSDIVRPRAEDAPDSGRRLTILDKYRAGKVTSADEPDTKSAAAIAQHVGQ
jgi:pilus assembly protein CpaD